MINQLATIKTINDAKKAFIEAAARDKKAAVLKAQRQNVQANKEKAKVATMYRAVGHWLDGIERAPGQPKKELSHKDTIFREAIADLGIQRQQAYRWISLTKVPESRWAELEELADNDNDLTLAQFYAAGSGIRAERRMGEMLKVAEKNTGAMGVGPPAALRSNDSTGIKLKDIGISKYESVRAQAIADIPEPEFDAVIAEHNAVQAKNVELETYAAEIKLRAQRRIGEISACMEVSPLAKGGRRPTVGMPGKNQTLRDAGISTSTAHRCEQIANVP